MFEYNQIGIKSSKVNIQWKAPEKLNGLNLMYFIRVFSKFDKFSSNLSSLVEQRNSNVILEHNKLQPINKTYFQTTINELTPYTEYFINFKACNQDIYDSVKFYCLEGIPQPKGIHIDSSNYLELITSQDKPELQPSPSVVNVYSNSIEVRVNPPLEPNGIVVLFEIWLGYLNDTQTRNLVCLIDDFLDPNNFK
jgi:hypothetical protein